MFIVPPVGLWLPCRQSKRGPAFARGICRQKPDRQGMDL